MNDDIAIRHLKIEDKDLYMNLFKKLLSVDFPEYSEKIKKYLITQKERSFDKEIGNTTYFYFGAFKNSSLVGIIDGMFLGGGVAICFWLLVDPDFQKQGFGKKLLSTVEIFLKEKGIHSMHLYSAKWNNPYYEKMGFEQVGLYKNGWYGSSDYLYAKTLQEPKEENFLQ